MNYDSFDNKYFPKRMVFFWDIQSFLLFRLYKYIQSVFYCKTDFGFAATIFNNTTLKVQTEAGFSFEMIVLAFLILF
jgi:NTE family protein